MAFVSGVTFGSSLRGNALCKRTGGAARGVVMMAEQEDTELWKTKLAGGFPGGEGFFRKWLDNGMKDYVPGLAEENQPADKPEGVEGPSKLGDMKTVSPTKEFPKETNVPKKGYKDPVYDDSSKSSESKQSSQKDS
mmetsp:Transcript_1556/g.4685  ORF Transcript_1556/g.4685 Transcript_1556/m.4685 type:complete len:136 (+) Transcript_1556:142-549(+)